MRTLMIRRKRLAHVSSIAGATWASPDPGAYEETPPHNTEEARDPRVLVHRSAAVRLTGSVISTLFVVGTFR